VLEVANEPRCLPLDLLIIYGKYGPVMTMEQLRETFSPSVSMKTIANKASARVLPKRADEVFDRATSLTGGTISAIARGDQSLNWESLVSRRWCPNHSQLS